MIRFGRIPSFNHIDDVSKLGFRLAPPFPYMGLVQPANEISGRCSCATGANVMVGASGMMLVRRRRYAQTDGMREQFQNKPAQGCQATESISTVPPTIRTESPRFSEATPDQVRICELA